MQNTITNATDTALLIIDIQNDYFPGGKHELAGSIKASLQAKKILQFFRTQKLPVLHIQHEWIDPEPKFFAPNTEGQKIQENVLPLPDETVLTKHQTSSFEQTSLLEHLQENKIQRLIVSGMQTNVCVLGTTKDAVKHNFDIIVLSDATAAVDSATHRSTLAIIEAEWAKLMAVDELIAEMT